MYNARYIIPGILIFLVAFTLPFWGNATTGKVSRPAIVLPEGEKECIESAAFMRAEHMRILNEWRDAALRDGKRSYVATDGKIWEISLQNTCMRCHTDKAQFCDTCHTANNVTTYCWDCHIAPKPQKAVATGEGK